MMHTDPQFVNYLQNIVEVLGTMAFAISGIRHAAAKRYDWYYPRLNAWSDSFLDDNTIVFAMYILCAVYHDSIC